MILFAFDKHCSLLTIFIIIDSLPPAHYNLTAGASQTGQNDEAINGG